MEDTPGKEFSAEGVAPPDDGLSSVPPDDGLSQQMGTPPDDTLGQEMGATPDDGLNVEDLGDDLSEQDGLG